MAHPIVHIEIPVNDIDTGGGFYAELFGWETQPYPELSYMTFATGDGPGGGFTRVDGEMARQGEVLIYVYTDDIPATLAKAESLGATTITPKTEIPGMGWFGVFRDPAGNRIALHTAQPGM